MITLSPSLIAYIVTSLLVALLSVAVWNDIKQYRIPNRLVLAGTILGLILNSVLPDGDGFVSAVPGALGIGRALAGMAVGLALMLPLYVLRAMGAGDVKLMAMIGAFVGPHAVAGAVLLTFVIGGMLSVGYSMHRKSLTRMIENITAMFKTSACKILFLNQIPVLDTPTASAGKLPYGIAIAAGTLSYAVLIKYTDFFKLF